MKDFKRRVGDILIILEIIWMVWFIALNIAANTTDSVLIRSTALSMGVHIGVILAIILVIGLSQRHIHIYLIALFIFEMSRDVFAYLNASKLLEIKEEYPWIYVNMLAMTMYQLALSTTALIWCSIVVFEVFETYK